MLLRMHVFRSEEMELCQVILYKETAFDCLVELGYEGKLEFRNVSTRHPVVNDIYAKKVEQCANLERIMTRFQEELNQLRIRTFYYPNVDIDHKPIVTDLSKIEGVLMSLNDELNEVIQRCMGLRKIWNSILEHRQVLMKTNTFLTGANNSEAQIISQDGVLQQILQNTSGIRKLKNSTEESLPLRFITGTVPVNFFYSFEKMVWRVSRGNAYIKREAFELPQSVVGSHSINRYKNVFILTFVGDELQKKLTKVCQGFGIRVYACPVLEMDRKEELLRNAEKLKDIELIYMQTLEHKQRILAAPSMDLFIWRSKIRKIKSIYVVMSRLRQLRGLTDGKNKYFEAECWIPKRFVGKMRETLLRGARRSVDGDTKHLIFPPILNVLKGRQDTPPTLFETNKFTKGFQDLVNAYGIAAYRELNPAPFSIVTFPFFFAVMFADMGHGLLLVVIATVLIQNEEKYTKHQRDRREAHEVFDLLFAGRYILLLMGIFSIYTGFIFNNVFSKTLNIFGSNWRVNFTYSDVNEHLTLQLDPARVDNFLGNPYLFGFDPVWDSSSSGNWITLANSLQMKASIVLGVAHMIFGIFLSAANAIFFQDKMELYFNFIPQLTFMCSIFLYLVILIFQKWFSYGGHETRKFGPGCAPSLFNTFLNMVFLKEPPAPPEGCSHYMYSAQPIVQRLLVIVAIGCVLLLLCGNPVRHYVRNRRQRVKSKYAQPGRQGTRKTLIALKIERISSNELLTKTKLIDVCIQQFITTTESVLGTISHTASYLRLWALSLAHKQLTFLVWKMMFPVVFRSGAGYLKPIMIFVAFAAFAILTVVFLVIMEGLAAFMHTLRLHWFEFQSKFYKGTGHAFSPFLFQPSRRIDEKT